jgi:hypothetical protein
MELERNYAERSIQEKKRFTAFFYFCFLDFGFSASKK